MSEFDTDHHEFGEAQDRRARLTVIRANPDSSIQDLIALFDMLALLPGQRDLRRTALPIRNPDLEKACVPTDRTQTFIP